MGGGGGGEAHQFVRVGFSSESWRSVCCLFFYSRWSLIGYYKYGYVYTK